MLGPSNVILATSIGNDDDDDDDEDDDDGVRSAEISFNITTGIEAIITNYNDE